MPSTYTTNLGIEKIATGEQSGTWGTTTNTNLDLIDEAVNGVEQVTLAAAGSSGSPNDLPVTNGASSDGRNKFIEFIDGGDLGGTAYVQLTPNDAEKVVHIRNSLSAARNIIIFQGTYNASNDFEIPNGADVVLKFDGAGAGAVVSDVNVNLTPTKLTTATADITTVNATTVDSTNLEVTNLKAKDGTSAGSIADSTGVVTLASSVLTTTDINGGTIDDTTIGGSTPAAGSFTTGQFDTSLNVDGTVTSDGLTVAGNVSVDGGTIKLDGNYPVGSNNVALGDQALDSLTSGGNSTAIGYQALTDNTSGSNLTAVGRQALGDNTTGSFNVAFGSDALRQNTTASNNTAVGYQSLYANTTGGALVAMGTEALKDNTTGTGSVGIGYRALQNNTTANNNVAIGNQALDANTTGAENVAIGTQALDANTTASSNTAVGYQALTANTTGGFNTAIGREALDANTTANNSTAVGYQALTNSNGLRNTAVGWTAGDSVTSGEKNTFIGQGSGNDITTGSQNTIVGSYSGNSGGLDIRTSSNNIVLSDGDGNPRLHIDSSGNFTAGTDLNLDFSSIGDSDQFAVNSDNRIFSAVNASFHIFSRRGSSGEIIVFRQDSTNIGEIRSTGTGTSYNTSSDYRLKENVVELTGATDRLKQLPVHQFNFIADPDTTVDGFLAHEAQAVVPEAVSGTKDEVDENGNSVYQGIDQSKLVPLLTAALKEAISEIESLKERVATLESN